MESRQGNTAASTHLLGYKLLSKPFNVKFTDKDGEEKLGFITCYSAISRIYARWSQKLGDDRGLYCPGIWRLAGCNCSYLIQGFKGKVLEACEKVFNLLQDKYIVKFDDRNEPERRREIQRMGIKREFP